MSRILAQSSRTKHVSSTPSSPPPLYSLHPPRAVGGGSLPASASPLPSPSSSIRLSAPLVFSTPPQSPPHNGSSSGSSFSFPRLHTPLPTPHDSSLPFLSTVELSPPPENRSKLQTEEHEQDVADAVEHLAYMGKKPPAAKKKGKAKTKAKAKALTSTSTLTTAPAATSVQWSEKQQHDAVQAPALYSTTASHGGAHKQHKGKKHDLHYAQDYEEQLADEEGYYDEHFELDERRGRSTRPRLLWRSHLDPLTLGVLDSHVVEVRGTKVPRLTGEGSVEGKKWSRELEKCGL